MKSIVYIAILITCLVGVGFALSESEESEASPITNPTNATLVDNIWYSIWDGEAIVRGPSSDSLTTITIPSTVTIDGQTYTVTGIAGISPDSSRPYQSSGAFSDMFSLTTVTLPYTLESFNAQYDADSANYTYSNAFAVTYSPDATKSKLTTVNWDIPEGETCHLTSIGPGVFQNCKKLATFDIPDSVTTIGTRAFESCNAYSISQFPSALTSIGDYAFISTAITVSSVPQTVTSIGENAFYNCKSIPSFTLPDTVTISPGVFGGCTSLQSLRLPAGLTAIPDSICSGCTSLTTVTMPTNYTSVEANAFKDCSGIHFALPANLTSVGANAFKGCTSMAIPSIPSGITTIPDYAFNGAMAGPRLVIPATVTSIGSYAFGMLRENGQVCTNPEIVFEGNGTLGNSTTEISFTGKDRIFQEPYPNNSYPTGSVITIYLYGKSYTDIYYAIYELPTVIINNYSGTYINTRSNITTNYYAIADGIKYSLTGVQSSTGVNATATILGLADDSVTSITVAGSIRYYYRTCNVTGIPGSATESGLGAFGGTGITSVRISSFSLNFLYNPNGSNFAYANTFKDCVNLTSVDLPAQSKYSIPAGMFYGCTNLDMKNIGAIYIGKNAFRDCSSLTLSNADWSVRNKLVTVGDHAFDGCTLFDPISLSFENRTGNAGAYAFAGCESLSPSYIFTLGINTTIGEHAFDGCTSLTTDTISNNVTLGNYAFNGCTSLNPKTIKDVTIGNFTFNGCTSLNPTTFSNISTGVCAFQNCTGLKSIAMQGTISLGPGVFNLVDIDEPTTEERSLSLLFLTDDVEYTPMTFASGGDNSYERIYNIVDMGNNGFTTASSGLPASATISNSMNVDAVRMIQKIEVEGKEGSGEGGISGTAGVLVALIPVLVGLGTLIYILGQLGILDTFRNKF